MELLDWSLLWSPGDLEGGRRVELFLAHYPVAQYQAQSM